MHRIGLVLASLLATAALAGCGSQDFNPDVIAQAADKTASAGGSKVAFVMRIENLTMHGRGFMDTKGRKGRLKFQVPQAGGTVEEVFVGRTMYFHFPAKVSDKIPNGKPWLKLNLDELGRSQGIDFQSLQSTSTSDPSQQLEQLRGAGEVKKVGSEKIRGTDTTHYKATVDLNKAAERAPASQRDAARRSIKKLIQLSGQSTIPVEVWIDSAGRLRRIDIKQSIKGESLTMTMDLYDFGTREAVKAPPASETGDFSDLLKQAQKG